MAAQGPTIWFWVGGGGAAATSLPHRAAQRLVYRISLIVPLLIGF